MDCSGEGLPNHTLPPRNLLLTPIFLKIFFIFTIFKVFVEFVKYFCCSYSDFLASSHVGSQLPTRDRTCTPCIGRRSLNHLTTREVPPLHFFFFFLSQVCIFPLLQFYVFMGILQDEPHKVLTTKSLEKVQFQVHFACGKCRQTTAQDPWAAHHSFCC